MKSRAFALLALASLFATAGSAFADFVPGRVRAGQRAEMRTVNASGIFASVEGAVATINYMDGKADPVNLTVALNNVRRMPYTLNIVKIQRSYCGDVYVASTGPSRSPMTIELKDFSRATCERVIQNIWEVKVSNIGGANDAMPSQLELVGNPEPIFNTL